MGLFGPKRQLFESGGVGRSGLEPDGQPQAPGRGRQLSLVVHRLRLELGGQPGALSAGASAVVFGRP